MHSVDENMSVEEFAKAAGVTRRTLTKYLDQGMPHAPARHIEIPRDRAMAWIEKYTGKNGRPKGGCTK